jgi:vacuolar protein-sorting-associated protein 4
MGVCVCVCVCPRIQVHPRVGARSVAMLCSLGLDLVVDSSLLHCSTMRRFMAVSSSDLVSKWQGQSERLVKMMFRMAREKAPSIVFVDEIDSLCGQRGEGESESSRRIKTEFLVQMSGVTPKEGERVLVLGATNTPWSLDQAMRRRFEKKIYIPLPDEEARLVMFKIHIGKKTRHTLTDADMRILAQRAHMRSGADIKILCKDALFAPVRRLSAATHFCPVTDIDRDDPEGKIMRNYWTPCSPGAPGAVEKGWSDFADAEREIIENPVSMRDMQNALEHTKAMTTQADLVELDEWQRDFGS